MTLPSKKRKLSDEASLPPIDVTSPKPLPSPQAPRKDSGASDDTAAVALKALSALDAHGRHPLKKRKTSQDNSSWEDDHALGLAPLSAAAEPTTKKDDKEATPPKSKVDATNKGSGTALDHLDALGDDAASLGSKQKATKAKGAELMIGDEGSGDSGTLASSNQRVLLEALMSSSSGGGSSARRDRLESWGGMSDLSATGVGGDARLGDAAAALAASALQYTGLIEDVTAAAHSVTGSLGSHSSGEQKMSAVPSRISLAGGGAGGRKGSGASEVSMMADGSEQVVPTIQAFVDAAMATVGDQLADLAGAVEMAASGADVASISSDYLRKEAAGVDSDDVSSTLSPLIGVSDPNVPRAGRPRSMSTSSKPLSVDYDAVAAAVNAAEAATGTLDLTAIGDMAPPPVPSVVLSNNTAQNDGDENKVQKSTMSEKDREEIRAQAREAAGYVPPSDDGTPAPRPPLKKRPKQPSPDSTPSVAYPDVAESTPRVSNVSAARRALDTSEGAPDPPLTVSSAEPTTSVPGVASQKWDDMFECLVQFVEARKEEDLKGASAEEREAWEWDGCVPASYKTDDGKALGRWVNNQRSAKTKGTLKQEREDKLLSTGFKWTVITTTSWQDMLNELRLYIQEKTKDGKEWDGNVPTNYRIRTNGGKGEEKNLGRWVNRQRSTKQAGRLRKYREKQLDDIGLKWSVLSTTSWDDMFQVLCEYVKERKAEDPNYSWDGNVPANYKTKGDDSKALGRWVNRQRSNYVKKKVKKEHIDRLNAIGLKWSVHDRRPYYPPVVPRAVPSSTHSSQQRPTVVPSSSQQQRAVVPSAAQQQHVVVSSAAQQQHVAVSNSSAENSNDNEEKVKIVAV